MAKSFDRSNYGSSKHAASKGAHNPRAIAAQEGASHAAHAAATNNPRVAKAAEHAKAASAAESLSPQHVSTDQQEVSSSYASASQVSSVASAAPATSAAPAAFAAPVASDNAAPSKAYGQVRTIGAAASSASAPRDVSDYNPGNPYSREAQVEKYGKERKRKKRNKVLITCLVVLLVVVLGGAGAAFAYMSNIQQNMQENVDPEMEGILYDNTVVGDPFYMVLMGTDKSADREQGDELDGTYRTDSIMLLRIDPKDKKVAAVSLMRDTMVDMGEYGDQKLNAAYALGGAPYTVQVVSDLADVPITHYAEIDFDGFKAVVDALGGIEVNVPMEINDPEAGGYLAAGPQTLNGDQALILCRSRHTYDDYGKGDEYRAAAQRMVISAIAQKILSADVPTMMTTVEALSHYVTTDMTVTEIVSLANSMRGIDMNSDFYTAVNPTESEYVDDVWWEVMDEDAWKKMMSRIDQGLPPTENDQVDESTGMVMASAGDGAVDQQANSAPKIIRSGTVSIRNGSDISGAAAEADADITAMGYTTDVGNASTTDFEETIVVYNTPDQEQYAQEIANALGVGKIVLNNNEYLFDTDFLVVIGTDWIQ